MLSSVTVRDPSDAWGGSASATITEAVAQVSPQGRFLLFDLMLHFAYEGSAFQPDDSLELVYSFSLPEDACIIDSWLWLEGDILRGKLMDRDTATRVYEDVVDRRVDPSILYKNNPTNYLLRIFPLTQNWPRRVKLTMLLPMEWYADHVKAYLPSNLFPHSLLTPPKPLKIVTNPTDQWPLPFLVDYRMEGSSGTLMRHHTDLDATVDSLYGPVHQVLTPIHDLRLADQPYLQYPSPMENGVYLGSYEADSGNYYQLGLQLDQILDSNLVKGRHVYVLLDHHEGLSNSRYVPLNRAQAGLALQDLLADHVRPYDSLQVLASTSSTHASNGIYQSAGGWHPAHPDTIAQLFTGLPPTDSAVSLDLLLHQAMDLDAADPAEGVILLFSQNQLPESLSPNWADQLIQGIDDRPGPPTPTYIVDHAHASGRREMFQELAALTDGFYLPLIQGNDPFTRPSIVREGDAALLELADDYHMASLSGFDFYTNVLGGFTEERRFFPSDEEVIYRPIWEIGQYTGEGDFFSRVSGYAGIPWSTFELSLTLVDSQRSVLNGTAHQAWASRKLRDLSFNRNSYRIREEILALSLRHRVLSQFTAFLCLEDPSYVCDSCDLQNDYIDDWLTSIPQFQPNSEQDRILRIGPNPFQDQVQVLVQLVPYTDLDHCTFEVFDLQGRLIRRLEPQVQPAGQVILQWDGRYANGRKVPVGLYLFRMHTPHGVQYAKLIKR